MKKRHAACRVKSYQRGILASLMSLGKQWDETFEIKVFASFNNY